MLQSRIVALLVLIAGLAVGYFVYATQDSGSRFAFKLGLDLSGGTHLVYRADTSQVSAPEKEASLAALRDVIERRVNIFGVSEPIVQVEESSALAEVSEDRLVVELPGVTDVSEAVRLIGETPLLEFRLLREDATLPLPPEATTPENVDTYFAPAELTGRFLEGAQLQFGNAQTVNEPVVVLNFTSEGAELFEQITRDNIGRILAIFLDGEPVSLPQINEAITGGEATISGSFTPEEARLLVRNLNFGALPVPIELISTQSIGASLGNEALERGLFAGVIGILFVAVFMILWYRLPGLISVLSLSIYIAIMLAIFKLVPVTLTAAGLAGFILSVGMAVDANVLIFERLKEELNRGKDLRTATLDGFSRAWLSIRDGNISSILTAIILFWFGTSLVKGFALTFGLGVMVSMLTAISVTRTFLLALGIEARRGLVKFLFGTGTSM